MRTSTVWVLGGVGVLGFLLWRHLRAQQTAALTVPTGTSPAQALITGMQAGIEAGTYDANALRNAMIGAGAPSTR